MCRRETHNMFDEFINATEGILGRVLTEKRGNRPSVQQGHLSLKIIYTALQPRRFDLG